MKRVVLQILLGIGGLLMFFRFGGPALVFGATGPGPFGNRWLAEGNSATLLLDSDLRFFGAMMFGIGVVLFWAISMVEAFAPVVYNSGLCHSSWCSRKDICAHRIQRSGNRWDDTDHP